MTDRARLVELHLDPDSFARATPDVEHERAVAVYDILEDNRFQPVGHPATEYSLTLSIYQQKLVMDIENRGDGNRITHILSLTPLKSAIRDYHMICESYYDAIKGATHDRIQAIDMARRGVHNDASEILMERLKGKIDLDLDTARRLFTLISALEAVR